jgi:hypothetical protein
LAESEQLGGFPHFVADGGDDQIGWWLDERIDLANRRSSPRAARDDLIVA